MPVLYVSKSWWNARSAKQKEIIKDTLDDLRIGDPAQYKVGAATYFVWDDSRLTLARVARISNTLLNAANMEPVVKDVPLTHMVDVQVEDWEWEFVTDEWGDTRRFRKMLGTFHTEQVEEALGDPYDLVMKAQGGPSGFKAIGQLPAGAVPVAR